MDDGLTERVEALERAVTDGDHDLSALTADADALERVETLESQVESLESAVADLDAATQALRGYVGNVRSVNERVERRADTALSKVESLEAGVGEGGATHSRQDIRADERSQDAHQTTAPTQHDAMSTQHSPSAVEAGRPSSQQTSTDQPRAADDEAHGEQPASVASDSSDRCHACGQTRGETPQVDTGTGTHQQDHHRTNGTGGCGPDDPLAGLDERPFGADESEDSGRLQRFRDLL